MFKREVIKVPEFGHPWTREPGYDLLYLHATSEQELEAMQAKAEEKFWHCWISGCIEDTQQPAAVMYKPSGKMQAWTDPGPAQRWPR